MAAHRTALITLTGTAVLVTACSSNQKGGGGDTSTVVATDRSCRLSAPSLTAGRHTFTASNKGGQVTEVYVYADGDRVVGEVENIGPGTSRPLTVDLAAGEYEVACKPGMSGSGIRTRLTVTGSTPNPPGTSSPSALAAAVGAYRHYVEEEAEELVETTGALVVAARAGDVAEARSLYPAAREHYERIEPIAESFGNLDPLIDMRADDVPMGADFVGFHRLERDLFQNNDVSADAAVAAALLANTRRLEQEIPGVEITALTMANGAKSLLDEVAKSKVTGEEERYSHIDLVDFQANVEGAQAIFTILRPLLEKRAAPLVVTLGTRFDTLLDLLATHRAKGGGFVPYSTLTQSQVKALAVAVDALSEPLGQLAAAVGAL